MPPLSDPRHLDATLVNLRAAAEDAARIVDYLTAARDALTAAPETEREDAARRLTFRELQMRGDARMLSFHFAALAMPSGETLA